MKPFLVLGTLALLCGCQDTTFESQPSRNMAACDSAFVGQWRLMAPDRARPANRAQDDDLFLIVEPDCKRWRFIENGKDDAKTERTTHFAFASVGGKALLSVKLDADDNNAQDPQARWKDGYYLFRYESTDKAIRVYPIDHKRMAHLIVDGTVSGRTERISREPGSAPKTQDDSTSRQRDELHNYVAGDEKEMARVAQLDGIFRADGYYTLKSATSAEIYKPTEKSSPTASP